jgi:hypothetical protein
MHTTDAYLQHHADRTARLRQSWSRRSVTDRSTGRRRSAAGGSLATASASLARTRPADGRALAVACR